MDLRRQSLLVALAACASACPVIDAIRGITPESAETGEAELENLPEFVDHKLDLVIACRDGLAETVADSWERYSEQVDDEGRPRRQRDGVFVHAIGPTAFRACDAAVANIDQAPPSMPEVEDLFAAMVEAGHAHAEHTRTLAAYLEEEGWEADDWVMLRSLHRELVRTHSEFAALDGDLLHMVDDEKNRNDAALLTLLEANDRKFEMHCKAVMVHARPFQRCLTHEPAPTRGACDAEYAALEQALDRFLAAYEANPAASRVFWMSTFAEDADAYRSLAREAHDALNRGRLDVDESLRDAYADLARDSHTLDFDFP